MIEVVRFVIMGVGFAFESYLSISVSLETQPYQPFNEIPDIKEHKGRFSHLSRVNTLMAHGAFGYPRPATAHQHTEKIDGGEAFEGNQVVAKNEHDVIGVSDAG